MRVSYVLLPQASSKEQTFISLCCANLTSNEIVNRMRMSRRTAGSQESASQNNFSLAVCSNEKQVAYLDPLAACGQPFKYCPVMIDTTTVGKLRQTVQEMREYYRVNKVWHQGPFVLSLPIVRYLCRDMDNAAFEELLDLLKKDRDIQFQSMEPEPSVAFMDAFLSETSSVTESV